MSNVSTTPNRQLPKWLRNATSVTAETLAEILVMEVYMSEKISFGLLENAFDFLASAVKYASDEYDVKAIKYGVLHLSAGVDLILKYRLSKDHWSLLFQNIDKARISDLSTGNFSSVNSQTCMSRLENNCQLKFSKDFEDSIKKLRELRNKMEHFKIDESATAIKVSFYRVLNGILNFIEFELDDVTYSIQENEYLDQLRSGLGELHEFIEFRLEELVDDIDEYRLQNYLIIDCPRCYQETTVIDDGGKCLFCGFNCSGDELAKEYVDAFFEINLYDIFSHGGECPIHYCMECGIEALVYEEQKQRWFCASCGVNYGIAEICCCHYCGKVIHKSDTGVCSSCKEYA